MRKRRGSGLREGKLRGEIDRLKGDSSGLLERKHSRL